MLWIHEVPLSVGGYSLEPWQRFGALGVILFFAISGVLISTRILEEEDLSGRFHIKLFYIRRFFRIQPAAWAFLVVVAALVLTGVVYQQWRYWFGALFPLRKLPVPRPWQQRAGELLRWALLDAGGGRALLPADFAGVAVYQAAAGVGVRRALLLLKVAQMYAMPRVHEPELRRTYWQIHMLLWPSLAAILLRKPAMRAWAQRFLKPWAVFMATFLLCAVAQHRSGALMVTVLSYFFTPWVIATMLHPRSWSTRLLETGPMRYIGRILTAFTCGMCCSSAASRAYRSTRAGWMRFLTTRGSLWRRCGGLGKLLLDRKPFVRLGHRLAPPATPGRRELIEFPAVDTPGTVTVRSV